MLWRTALLALIGEVCEAMTTQQALPAIDRRSIVLGRAESHESPELKKVKTQLKNDSNIFKQFQCLAPLSWLRLWPIISCLCIYNHDSWSWFMIMINHVHFIHANNIKQPNLWHLTARHSPTKAWWRWGGVVGVAGLFGVNTTLLGLSPESAKWEGTWENKIKSLKSREWQAQSSARWQWTSQKGSKRMLNVYHFFHCNWCTCMQLCMSELLTCRKWCKGGGDSDTPE